MLHTPSSAPLWPVTDSASLFLSVSQLHALKYTHFSILAVSHSASPTIAFCLEDTPPPYFFYSMHPSTVLRSLSECSFFSSLGFERPPPICCQGFSLFSFFPLNCFSNAFSSLMFLPLALLVMYTVVAIAGISHAPFVFHKWYNSTFCLSLLFCINTMLVLHTQPTKDVSPSLSRVVRRVKSNLEPATLFLSLLFVRCDWPDAIVAAFYWSNTSSYGRNTYFCSC